MVVNIKESEFVWVPVEDVVFDEKNISKLPINESDGTISEKNYKPMAINIDGNYYGLLYNYDSNGIYLKYGENKNYQGGGLDSREPYVVSYDQEDYAKEGIEQNNLQKEYNDMIESILRYKGFYIARYEAGLDKKTNEIVFKDASKDENNVITTDASNSKTYGWYGLYKKIREFTNDDDLVVSNMIWGSQYDAMLNWISKNGYDVASIDNTKRNKFTITGKQKDDVINNIFDLYGCHREWTLEAYSSNRVIRGSDYDNITSSISFRNNDGPDKNYDTHSVRASLYIKN